MVGIIGEDMVHQNSIFVFNGGTRPPLVILLMIIDDVASIEDQKI
jgi:hypothetical protein